MLSLKSRNPLFQNILCQTVTNEFEEKFQRFYTREICARFAKSRGTIIRVVLFGASCGVKLLPPASEGWGKVMFSVCSHIWGGGGQVQLPGGVRSSCRGRGVRSSCRGGVRSSCRGGSGPAARGGGGSGPASGGGGGQVQPVGGGQVQLAGGGQV